VLEVMRFALLCMLEVLEAMRCVLLCMLEAVEGRLCLLEVFELHLPSADIADGARTGHRICKQAESIEHR